MIPSYQFSPRRKQICPLSCPIPANQPPTKAEEVCSDAQSDLHIEELWTFALPIPGNRSVCKETEALARKWPPSHGNPDYYNDAFGFLCDSSFIPSRIASGDPTKASNLLKSFRQNCAKRFRLALKPHPLTSSQLLYFKKGRKGSLSWNYVPFSDELEDILELCHRKKGSHGSMEETLAEFETLGIWWDRAKQTVYAFVQECSCVVRKRGSWVWRSRRRREETGGRLDLLEDVYQPSNPFD